MSTNVLKIRNIIGLCAGRNDSSEISENKKQMLSEVLRSFQFWSNAAFASTALAKLGGRKEMRLKVLETNECPIQDKREVESE